MAYTIISQNNSTTTLSDGVNTITVPSRVNLTSGNFTIVEVNNNMATLEDGDGNVYRDIPCVATLAGEGGGGGSGLPDQTGHSGEFLTTDGTNASWGTTVEDAQMVIKNTASSQYSAVNQISFYAKYNNSDGTAATISSTTIGTLYISGTSCTFDGNLMSASVNKNIGSSGTKWGKIYVEKINNGANITVPNQAGTMVVADSTSATAGQVLTLDSNLQPVWQAASGGTQIQYSTMPDATENAGSIVQYTGATSAQPPVFTIDTQTPSDMIIISDPTAFLNAVNNSGTGSFVAGYYVELNASETGGSWDIGVVLYNNEGTDIGYGSINTSSPETDCGITIQGFDPSWNAQITCDSVGSQSNYTNGYFYKSVSGSSLQFITNEDKLVITNPTQFLYKLNNSLSNSVTDGTTFEIHVNVSENEYNIDVFANIPSNGSLIQDSCRFIVLIADVESQLGISVVSGESNFQTYASYTSSPTPQFYIGFYDAFSLTDSQVFMDFIENISSVTLEQDDEVNIGVESSGTGFELYITIGRNGSSLFDSQMTVATLEEIGISLDTGVSGLPTNCSFYFISTGSGGGYHWQQVNVQPITADSIAPTTGLADGNYNLRLTIVDGVPTLSWVAE